MQLTPIGLPHVLTLGAAMFALGLYAVIARRNALLVLIGIELMLLAATVNFVAFSRLRTGAAAASAGESVALLLIVLGLCQLVVALAIVRNIYRRFATARLDEVDLLRD